MTNTAIDMHVSLLFKYGPINLLECVHVQYTRMYAMSILLHYFCNSK